jgi:hypothetical protein
MRRSQLVLGFSAVTSLLLPVWLLAVGPEPVDPGEPVDLTTTGGVILPVLISNCGTPEAPVPCPGDQFDPHVDGDLVSYTSQSNMRYYDFFTGADAQVPGEVDAVDQLGDVSNGKIAFSRWDAVGHLKIMVFDTATSTTVEVDPQPSSMRAVAAIGSDTVAFQDWSFGVEPNDVGPELVASLLGGAKIRVTNDTRWVSHPSVAPLGDLIAYESCQPSPFTCDIHQAQWNGSTWVVTPLASSPGYEANPNTDGVGVVYDADRSGERDVYWQPVGGGSEKQLVLAGEQRNPSVSGGLILFESVAVGDSTADLFVYHIATNRLFQITSTPLDEMLNDVSVMPNGQFRIVWSSGTSPERDVFGATIILPDIDPPVITCEPAAADGLWHADNVTFACTAEDTDAGLANPADASFTLVTNLAAGNEWANEPTDSREVCDNALPEPNCATAGPISGNMIDRRAPSVSVTTPATGASYTLGQAVTADYGCEDNGSGVQSCSGPVTDGQPIDTLITGAKTFAVSGTDNVGNSALVSVPYSVVAPPTFNFGGFLPPVDPLPTVNSMKAGAAVPVKFSLGGFQGLNIFAAGYPKSSPTVCGSSAMEDGVEQTVSAGDSSLSYDAATGVYSYIWKTDKGWAGTCRQLVVKFTDGSMHYANFKFK